MAWNGSGQFLRVMNWVSDAASGIKIRSDRHDAEDNNLADGITNCIARDGQSVILQNIPFSGKRITNLGDPTAAQDAVTRAWVDSNVTGGALIADAPPAAGKVGNLWWDSDQGNLYLRYDDGSSVQWVQVNVASPAAPIVDSGVFKLSEGTLAAPAATVEIALPAGYLTWELTARNIVGDATNQALVMRFSIDDGATWISSGNYFWTLNQQSMITPGTPSNAAAAADTSWIGPQWCNSSAPASMFMRMIPHSPSFVSMQMETNCFRTDSSSYTNGNISGRFNVTTMPNKLRLYLSAGRNFAAGLKWQLNGIK